MGAPVYCTFKTLTRLVQQNESSLFAVLIADVGKKNTKITENYGKLGKTAPKHFVYFIYLVLYPFAHIYFNNFAVIFFFAFFEK